ncbi:MAG: trigger factor [Pelagibacterales bacterium]|nr:trigger factor [Pelagibacterales bacterium]
MEVKIKNVFDKKLKKDYQITVPYQMIEEKIKDNVSKIKENIKLDGFRKGQVPEDLIRQKYGQSIMADESDKIISDTLKKIVKDNNLKPALPPKVDVKTFEANKDLEITVSIELYPEVPEVDVSKSKVVKREVEVTSTDVDEALSKLLKFYRSWDSQDFSYKAKKGDSVNIDYLGRIDKVEFEGGKAEGYQLELGSKSFIDDFEDQLVGKKSGDQVKVKVKFPKEYHSAEFAGKAAEFDVKVNSVLTAKMPEVSDQFIKDTFGIETKAKLEEEVKKQVENNYESISRNLFKKEFFDFVNKKHDFELPEGLVEEQVKNLWADVEAELESNPNKFKNEKEKEKAKEKKREMAVRMIRCGMVLNELAQKNKIEANNEDINKEIGKILARFANQEKAVLEYYQKNPGAIQQLRGSIIEEKTIDFILSQSSIEKKKISIKDLDKAWQKANEE